MKDPGAQINLAFYIAQIFFEALDELTTQTSQYF